MIYAKKSAHLGVGLGLGAYGALKLDDMVYTQLKKHVILPFQVLANSQNIQTNDLKEIGVGTKTFIKQFKPLAMDKRNAKALMIDDGDYSTPQDHYFGYINKRIGESQTEREKNEESIYRKLQDQLDTQDPVLNEFENLMEAQ